MKIGLISDMHVEFGQGGLKKILDQLVQSEVDVMVFAGDIHNAYKLGVMYRRFSKLFSENVFVLGNHEFYGSSVSKVLKQAESIQLPNVHYLNNSSVEIGGVLFGGGTLWYQESLSTQSNKMLLNDFNYIKDYDPWVFQAHEETRKFIETFTEGDSEKVRVVVTHHAPTYRSVPHKYFGDPLNDYYVARMEHCLGYNGLWLHGHMHDPVDYMAGNTRVLANPLGYPNQNSNWESLVIEI